MFPEALKACSQKDDEFLIIVKMAEVFHNPFSLVYHVGKSLIVNGVDIHYKIKDAINAYNTHDYFNFGRYYGEAMDEVFLHMVKPDQ